MTAEQYRSEFETLCLQAEADIVDISDRARDADLGSDELLELNRETVAATAKFTDGIAGLRPPSELDSDHQALLGYIDDVRTASETDDFDASEAASIAAETLIAQMGIDGCS